MRALAVITASCLVVSQGFNVTSNVPCSETHIQFQQPNLTKPNGGYTAAASHCQQTCKDMVYCDHFTWFPKSPVPGACYLFGNEAVKVASTDAISGPSVCSNETAAPVVVQAAAPAPEVVVNSTAPLVVTDGKPVEAAADSGGKSFPWFLILALLLVACCVCGIAYAAMGKSKKSSRSAKLTNESEEEEAPAVYEQQFQEGGVQMAQMQPIPMMYTTTSYAAVPASYAPASYAVQSVDYQQAAPQQYYYTSQGPMLYTEASQLAPVDYIQQPVEYYQGDVQYVQGEMQYVVADPQMMPQV